MKIENRRPQKTADVSAARGTGLSELIKLVLLAVGLVATVIAGVTIAVNVIVKHIPYELEEKLFSNVYAAENMESVTEKDSDALNRAREILDELTEQPATPPLQYNIFLVKKSQPNAFAFPGGGIGITRGLLEQLESDIALAFVLGHELGHFKHKDHLRGIGQTIGFNLAFSIMFGSSLNNQQLLRIANKVIQRQYSRQQEMKADRFSVELVQGTYGKTKGVTRLFEILKERELPAWAYMFATHPAADKRIERLRKYADTLQNQSSEEQHQ